MKSILAEMHHCLHKIWIYLDSGVLAVAIATFFGWLPDITAFFGLIYLLIRLWETDTVRSITKRTKIEEK